MRGFPAFQRIAYGAAWGVAFFAPHFMWLYVLLLSKSHATVVQATLLYVCIVCYASALSGIMFLLFRWLGFVLSASAFFLFATKYSLWFWGRWEGYPFINPLVPLAKYKWFLCVYGFACSLFFPGRQPVALDDYKICYIQPTYKAGQRPNLHAVGQGIYHALCNLELETFSDAYKDLIVVAPESAFPFCLNKQKKYVRMWGAVLPGNSHFFIGAHRRKKEGSTKKYFQSVFWLHRGLIMQAYDKKHLVPFVETMPVKWNTYAWAHGLFLKDVYAFSTPCDCVDDNLFRVAEHLCVAPKICSELFFCSERVLEQANLVLLFVNDSWFMGYIKDIMRSLAQLAAAQRGVPVVYVAHSGCDVLT